MQTIKYQIYIKQVFILKNRCLDCWRELHQHECMKMRKIRIDVSRADQSISFVWIFTKNKNASNHIVSHTKSHSHLLQIIYFYFERREREKNENIKKSKNICIIIYLYIFFSLWSDSALNLSTFVDTGQGVPKKSWL